jgi:hypothetical protein
MLTCDPVIVYQSHCTHWPYEKVVEDFMLI